MRLLGLLVLLITAGCAQFDIAAVNLPTHFDDTKSIRDITYNASTGQKLDIYRPDKVGKKLPVVVFFYGGRWQDGSKDYYPFVGSAFAEKNFITVIADYRKYPLVKFPAFVDDAASALAWVKHHIAEYGGDADTIHVLGHSAGAHIGALLVTDPRYLKKYHLKRSVIKSFAGLAGPYAFTPDEPDLMDIFGPAANYRNMRVTSFADGKEPPMLLLWGDDDTAVKKYNMDRLATAIRMKHGCVKTKTYPATDHLWILANLSWLGDGDAAVLDDISRFFQHPACN